MVSCNSVDCARLRSGLELCICKDYSAQDRIDAADDSRYREQEGHNDGKERGVDRCAGRKLGSCRVGSVVRILGRRSISRDGIEACSRR